VRALVRIAVFAPDEGETLFESTALGGGTTDLDLAAFLAVAQRGFALSCLSTPSGWRAIPSWYSAPERTRWRSPARTSR
jgi:hypothetical protein